MTCNICHMLHIRYNVSSIIILIVATIASVKCNTFIVVVVVFRCITTPIKNTVRRRLYFARGRLFVSKRYRLSPTRKKWLTTKIWPSFFCSFLQLSIGTPCERNISVKCSFAAVTIGPHSARVRTPSARHKPFRRSSRGRP